MLEYRIFVDGLAGGAEAALATLRDVRRSVLALAEDVCGDPGGRGGAGIGSGGSSAGSSGGSSGGGSGGSGGSGGRSPGENSGGDRGTTRQPEMMRGLGYLWQAGAFAIDEPTVRASGYIGTGSSAGDEEPHLRGRVCFGDAVDDEWLCCWLLVEATKRDPRLSVRVVDNDGEFILIETSPAWPTKLARW